MIDARIRIPVSQRGNALFISLVFLVILTTLGVSVAGTGRLELMMAANTQFGNQAYQAAESGIDSVLRIAPGQLLNSETTTVRNFFFNPTTSDGGFDDPSTTADPTRFAEQAITTTTYEEVGNVPDGGYSMSVDDSIVAHHFTIDSRSQSQRGGRAGHEQGIYIVGPGGK
ncbi:MAG: pilus assembly PilX family protein [Gammaproteobacteria bacterium]